LKFRRTNLKWSSTCLNVRKPCYNISRLILIFLWNDTWLISGKSFSTWQRVMKFLPEGGNWQLHSTSSADTQCKSEYLTLLLSKFWRPVAVLVIILHCVCTWSTFYFINFQFLTCNNDNLFKKQWLISQMHCKLKINIVPYCFDSNFNSHNYSTL